MPLDEVSVPRPYARDQTDDNRATDRDQRDPHKDGKLYHDTLDRRRRRGTEKAHVFPCDDDLDEECVLVARNEVVGGANAPKAPRGR